MTTKTDTEQGRAELLPCPFCGGEPSITKQMGESLWSHDIVLWTQVQCDGCEAHVGPTCEGFEVEAVDIWNRRAALQSQTDAGWKEAFKAWNVCASIHREWAKGKDAVFTTRQADFVWNAENAFKKACGAAALQSQDREDAIPADIRLMAQRIAADTFEHCTADPIFTVERRRTITGLDTNYTDNIGWFDTDSGDRVEGDEADALEARHDVTGDEPEGYVRTGYFEEWEHYATFITMQAAQEFAKAKGENYRVYVDSGCRNHEWKALRAFLLSIDHARRVEGEAK